MKPWNPTAPLPCGITQLEASAGTGKTYAIVDLCVRLIAEEGLQTSELVVVTFTRAATAELKDRVRERLSQAIDVLEGRESPKGHATLEQLDARTGEERRQALLRLRRASQTFDEILIATIHGFCQRMLQQHAFESGADLNLDLVEDPRGMIDEILQDWKTRQSHSADAERVGWLEHSVFTEVNASLCKAALDDPTLPIAPIPDANPTATWQALIDDWPRLRRDTELAVAAHEAAGGFRPRQRTWNAKGLPSSLDALDEALRKGSALGNVERGHWTRAKAADLAAPDFDPIELELLDRLDAHEAEQRRLVSHALQSFVVDARAHQERFHREHRTQSFSDLIRGLARCVGPEADPVRRDALIAAARGRFRAALIDEFQDTDHAQWTIFQALFSGPRQWLFLIGDPKQAIYGFRGANLDVYLSAGRSAGDRVFTMKRNYRSDADLLEALNHTLDQQGLFGQRAIPYVPVDAPDRPVPRRIRRTDGEPVVPLQFRVVDFDGTGPLKLGVADALVAEQCGRDVLRLLEGHHELHRGEAGWSPLMPGDLAVLVRTGVQARLVYDTLRALNVPAVISRAGDVFASEAFTALRLWLAAMVDPREGPARASFCHPIVGVSADLLLHVDDGDEQATSAWNARLGQLRQWRERAVHRGIHEAALTWIEDTGIRTRLLEQPGGERKLTDLLHLIELLHTEQTRTRMGLSAALNWLDQTRAAPSDDDTYPVRLERDDEAVRITTIHASKGLEYPVTLVPWTWRRAKGIQGTWFIAPDADDPTQRILHLSDDPAARMRAGLESAREDTRLLYVALTRSRTLTLCHAVGAVGFFTSMAATWMLGTDGERHRTVPELDPIEGQLFDALSAFCASDHVEAEAFGHSPNQPWSPPTATEALCGPKIFTRRMLDPQWRQYSYTALTRGTELHTVGDSGPRVGFDADADATHLHVAPAPETGVPCPLATFPGGAQAGVCLHAIFEHADFAWARPDGNADALTALAESQLTAHGYDAELANEVTPGLIEALKAPLGGPLADMALCDIGRPDRMDELRFDLLLTPERQAGPTPTIAGLGWARCLRPRVGQPNSPITSAYLDTLDGLPDIAGTMTGSIDLVFRAEVNGQVQWFIADYKSNLLGPRERLTTAHYAAPALTEAMAQHHYFLQYHLYLVALHRFLKWRLPGYRIERDLGGAYYLFVRGMVGEQPGRGCFFDAPEPSVIEALDALLDPQGRQQ